MNMNPLQGKAYTQACDQAKLAEKCVELRQRVLVVETVDVLNKAGKRTGKTVEKASHVTRIFRIGDPKIALAMRSCVFGRAHDSRSCANDIVTAKVWVDAIFNLKKVQDAGITRSCEVWVAEGGFIGHASGLELLAKIAHAEKMIAANGTYVDPCVATFRANSVRGTEVKVGEIEIVDMNV